MKTPEEIQNSAKYDINTLKDIMELLRSPIGCPWDREQSHKSIRRDFIEETYEAVEAIDRDDSHLLREELGDVLLQVVFHARIEEESGRFTLDDVIHDICAKLIYRHPHVFGDVTAKTSDVVLENWDKLKGKEKKDERPTVTADMKDLPKAMPELMRAHKVGKKAAKSGFDFDSALSALEKVYEEADEVKETLTRADKADMTAEEIGDLLLAVTNVARLAKVDSEEALGCAVDKFIDRFEYVENTVIDSGREIKDLSASELDDIWTKKKGQLS